MSDQAVNVTHAAEPRLAPYAGALGLVSNPFPVTPDETRYFFTPEIEAVYEELRHFIEMRKGFLLLTGDVGLGKTTLLRRLIAAFDRRQFNTALLLTGFLNKVELLEAIARDFDLPPQSDARRIDHLTALNEFLLRESAEGKINVLFIDDAQALDADALDVVRQLSNLETARSKLIQIVLCGQPELLDTLNQYSLRQVKSRIALHREVRPLNLEQTHAYVHHRLMSAGSDGAVQAVQLTPQALQALHGFTEGVPRRIHHLMDRCLYGLMVTGGRQIDEAAVCRAAADLGWQAAATKEPMASVAVTPSFSASRTSGWTPFTLAPGGRHALVSSAVVGAVVLVGYLVWTASPPEKVTGPNLSPTVSANAPGSAPVSAPVSALTSVLASSASPFIQPVKAATVIDAPKDWPVTRLSFAGLDNLQWPSASSMSELKQEFQKVLDPQGWQMVAAAGAWADACPGRPMQQLSADQGDWHLSFIERDWPTSPVSLGHNSEAVRNLQRLMVAQVWLGPDQVDGIMGPRTVAALARFQVSQGISGTGQFDPATAYRLSCRWSLGAPARRDAKRSAS